MTSIEPLKYKGISIDFKRSVRAKRLRLQVDSSGRFKVVAPFKVSDDLVADFIHKNESWLLKHKEKLKDVPTFTYKTGDNFYYFGEKIELIVKPCVKKRSTVKVRENKMIISLYSQVSEAEGVRQVRSAIEKFYKKKAEEVIYDRLHHFNQFYKYSFNKVSFRNQKTRWGSCSSKGNLNFNWRLIMAPIEVIDYVVVHELCHLKEMNHSSRFWKLVEKEVPDYKKWTKWLKENAYLLTF